MFTIVSKDVNKNHMYTWSGANISTNQHTLPKRWTNQQQVSTWWKATQSLAAAPPSYVWTSDGEGLLLLCSVRNLETKWVLIEILWSTCLLAGKMPLLHVSEWVGKVQVVVACVVWWAWTGNAERERGEVVCRRLTWYWLSTLHHHVAGMTHISACTVIGM